MHVSEGVPLSAILDLGRNQAKNDLAQAALDAEGVPYGVCFVSDFDDPRLRVGRGELIGVDEIVQHMTEIKNLVM